jgi:hypothetical protein
MNDHGWFEQIPTLGLAVATIAAFVAAMQGGMFCARRRARLAGDAATKNEGVGVVVGALFGLLGFMLAFTFGMAASRREARRDLLLDEVNSIGTTYLRAGMLAEPHQSEVRRLLRDYVDLRLDLAEHPEHVDKDLQQAGELQKQLWEHAEAVTREKLEYPDLVALFVASLNETIDLQTKRVTVGRYRIPLVVWSAFMILMVLAALALGFHFGQTSSERHWLMTVMLAFSFAVVTFLIFDLDRGAQGWLQIDQRPMYELREQMTP